MKIYLAGKIKRNCWRHSIVDDLINAHADGSAFPVLRNAIFGQHDYVGPYFTNYGHGCSHGDGSHGIDQFLQEQSQGDTEVLPRRVTYLCREAIDRADVVFTWIDDPTCYGTLVELGYANAKGKEIWICGPEQDENLWFALMLANRRLICSDPVSALKSLLLPETLRSMPYQDYLKTEHWKEQRTGALGRAGHRCQLCNSADRLEVHHRTYERRGSELPSDLIVLCRLCHGKFHNKLANTFAYNGRVHS